MSSKLKYAPILIYLTIAVLFPVHNGLAQGSSDETRAVILALFEAFNRHDTEALVALYSENARTFSPGDTEYQVGREAVRETYQSHFDNIPGVHDAVKNVIAEGERGSVEFIASWDQPTEADPAARGSLRIAAFITVRNGQIIQDFSYFDRVDLAEKMNIAEAE